MAVCILHNSLQYDNWIAVILMLILKVRCCKTDSDQIITEKHFQDYLALIKLIN